MQLRLPGNTIVEVRALMDQTSEEGGGGEGGERGGGNRRFLELPQATPGSEK